MDINKVQLLGRLGADPEIRKFDDGGAIANLRVATSQRWKDKSSGEQRERTEWHRVSVRSSGLIDICERFLKKGSRVLIEGELQTRRYEKDGETRYATEINVPPFRGQIIMLDARPADSDDAESTPRRAFNDDRIDDEIPF